MTKISIIPVLIGAMAITFAMPMQAAEFDSVFAHFNLDQCATASSDKYDTAHICAGVEGVPLYIATAGDKDFVSNGSNAPMEMAAQQTLPGVNHVDPEIEWRLSNASGEWKPFATIQRWFTRDGSGIKGEVLVVTKIEKGNTCHTAYIDAVVTPLYKHKARLLADLCAAKFRCGKDTPIAIPAPADAKQRTFCANVWLSTLWQ